MKSWTVEDIDEARQAIVRNAHSLLKESRVLLALRRYPRAYVVAHVAIEELGKLPMLARARRESELGEEVDWERLGQRMGNHVGKARNLYTVVGLVRGGSALHFGVRHAVSIHTNKLKNAGLYVDVSDEGVTEPETSITRKLAVTEFRLARICYKWFAEIEQSFDSLTLAEMDLVEAREYGEARRPGERLTDYYVRVGVLQLNDESDGEAVVE